MTLAIEDFVKETVHSVCTLSDLKNICRARCFHNVPQKGGKSDWADFVQLRFMNETGLDVTFSKLDSQVMPLLHFLKIVGKPIGIKELTPFLLKKNRAYYYREDIKEAFNIVVKELVSNGVALVKHDPFGEGSNDSKWSGYVVYLPPEFAQRLPPPPLNCLPMKGVAPNEKWAALISENIVHCLRGKTDSSSFEELKLPRFHLDKEVLMLENKIHPTMEGIHQALVDKWLNCQACIQTSSTKMSMMDRKERYLAATRRYLLESIPSGHGIKKENFEQLCAELQSPFIEGELAIFIKIGVHCGFLAEYSQEGSEYIAPQFGYSLANSPSLPLMPQENEGKVQVKFHKNSSIDEFLTLARASLLSLAGEDEIVAVPSPKYIGRYFAELAEHPFIERLQASSPLYQKAFTKIKGKVGKVTLHSGLTLIKLNHIDVESVLLSNFSERMFKVSEGYYVVSQEDLFELVQCGKKKGFTPKFIRSPI